MPSKRTPDWFKSFRKWLEQPCPVGEWLYRGQAKKHSEIKPKLLRDPHNRFYRVRLYEISNQVARAILLTSPVLGPMGFYPHVTPGEKESHVENLIADLFGAPPQGLPWVSLSEIIRALAQHYGFPTLFMDLTLNPMVAAFFATHTSSKGPYTPRDDEPGIVYRWPALRKSPARLRILIKGREDAINAIDLSEVSSYIRRPRNQGAVLATPVIRPFSFFSPESLGPSIISPIEDLEIINMASLKSCNRFELPAWAGHELSELTGVNSEALFPDRIDLGYSYISIIALLSLIIHAPDEWYVPGPGEPDVKERLKSFDDGVLAGRIILDRECYRLVPQLQPTEMMHRCTLVEAKIKILHHTSIARRATLVINLEEVSKSKTDKQKKLEGIVQEKINQRKEALKIALKETFGDDMKTVQEIEPMIFKPSWRSADTDWILSEINERLKQALDIIENAGKVPAYALENPRKYNDPLGAFPSDAQYKKEVKSQINGLKLWVKKGSLFPLFVKVQPKDINLKGM